MRQAARICYAGALTGCGNNNDIVVDDDLHLNENGYAIWTSAIREVLMAHEAQYE